MCHCITGQEAGIVLKECNVVILRDPLKCWELLAQHWHYIIEGLNILRHCRENLKFYCVTVLLPIWQLSRKI